MHTPLNAANKCKKKKKMASSGERGRTLDDRRSQERHGVQQKFAAIPNVLMKPLVSLGFPGY